jgi:benzoate-CoA ligase family protein
MVERLPDHSVQIDKSGDEIAIKFAPIFNVAFAFIDRHVEEGRGDRFAILTSSEKITFAELSKNVARAGNALRGLGLSSGERVLMVVRDSPAFLYAFWGAIKAGYIAIPVSTMLKAADYAYLIDDSMCSAVIYSDGLDQVAESSKEPLASKATMLPTSWLIDEMAHKTAVLEPAATASLDDCFWLYSSGSTGNPKGVVHRHRDMVVTSECYGKGVAGLRQDDIVFCASKLFFSFGFGGGMTFPLWAGATTILSEERPSADMAFATIAAFKPTYFFCVPTLYGQMLAAMENTRFDPSTIRGASSAGEALPAHIFQKWKEATGIPIIDGIGSTEVLHIFVSNRHDDHRAGTSGRPVPGYQTKVVDADGKTLPIGEVGNLWVKGISNARCYWNNEEKTAETMRGEWINTGDMYYVDPDGYYVNVGRGDDMFKVGAMWCSPIEIEAHLLTHPQVREVAIVGRTDADNLIKPAAYIVLKVGAEPHDQMQAELMQFCKAGLAGFKYPRWITFVDQLPKTFTGKIQRFRLRQALVEKDKLGS